MPRLTPRALLVAFPVVAALAVHYAHVLFGHAEGDPTHAIDTWLMDAEFVAAGGLAVLAAVRGTRPRGSRVLLALGVSSYGLAYIYFHHILAPTAAVTFPTPSDVLWLGFYAAVFLMLGLELRRHARMARLLWLDAAVNAFALAAIGWQFVVMPVLTADGVNEQFALGNASYLIGDLAIAGMLVALLTRARFRISRGTAALSAAVVLLAAGDFGYASQLVTGTYVMGALLDPIWVTALLLVGLASWLDRDGSTAAVDDEHGAFATAAIPPALATLSMTAVVIAGEPGPALGLAVVSVICVCLRLVVTLRVNENLLDAVSTAESSYRGLVETSQDVIWSIGLDGRITFMNDASTRVLGVDAADLVGRPIADLLASDRRESAVESFAAVVDGNAMSQYQTEIERPDGTRRTLLVSGAPKRDARNRVVGTTGTAADVTALVEAQAERARLQDRAQTLERLEAVGRLSGGIAHDFNNLTAIILSYAEFLADAVEEPQARSDLQEIRRAAERAAELTRQLLVFARHDVGERELVDANDRLEETGRLLRRTLGEDVEVAATGCTADAFVELGPGQFDQMIMNLALNARDALPGGGRIDLALARPDPGTVRLTVSDDGCGMDEEIQQRVFEPFFTTKETGTGLGLATVYGIVLQAGGFISVASRPGAGTTFTIDLPAVGGHDPLRPLRPARDAAATSSQGTVLVVEDEPALLEVIVRVLRRDGLDVLTAGNGEEALERAGEHTIDVLLTDVVMPGMSGKDTADRVRQMQPGVVIMFMTGYNPDVIAPEADYVMIRKPFAPADLLDRVHGGLAAAQACRDGESGLVGELP